MIEVLLLVAASAAEAEERFTLVSIEPETGQVRHWTSPISGSGIRQLLSARGEERWCIDARVAIARQQWADAECHSQQRVPLPTGHAPQAGANSGF